MAENVSPANPVDDDQYYFVAEILAAAAVSLIHNLYKLFMLFLLAVWRGGIGISGHTAVGRIRRR